MSEPLKNPACNLIVLQANEIASHDDRFHDITRAMIAEARHVDATNAALQARVERMGGVVEAARQVLAYYADPSEYRVANNLRDTLAALDATGEAT